MKKRTDTEWEYFCGDCQKWVKCFQYDQSLICTECGRWACIRKKTKKSLYLRLAEFIFWLLCINILLGTGTPELFKSDPPTWAKIIVVFSIGMFTFVSVFCFMSRKHNAQEHRQGTPPPDSDAGVEGSDD